MQKRAAARANEQEGAAAGPGSGEPCTAAGPLWRITGNVWIADGLSLGAEVIGGSAKSDAMWRPGGTAPPSGGALLIRRV